MAQNITLLGASYSDVPAVSLPKTGGGTASFVDTTDATATADKILQGYTAYGADGSKLTGTATGGGGSVTQDQDGYIVLPSTGGGGNITVEALSVTQNGTYTAQTGHAYSPVTVSVSGGGGLKYETGTFTTTSDVTSPYINFSDTHTDYPIYINMVDTTETLASENSMLSWTFINWYDAFGTHVSSTSSVNVYGRYTAQWKTSSGITYSNTDCTSLDGNSGGLYYLLNNTLFAPYGFSSSRYWRNGRTYKWIAVWAPTT